MNHKKIWSTRSMEELVMLEKELQDVAEEEDVAEAHRAEMMRFSVHLHLTSGVSVSFFHFFPQFVSRNIIPVNVILTAAVLSGFYSMKNKLWKSK